MNNENKLLSPAATAEQLGVTVGTLAVWRATKRYGLSYVKVGKCVRYAAADVAAFIAQRTVQPQAGVENGNNASALR